MKFGTSVTHPDQLAKFLSARMATIGMVMLMLCLQTIFTDSASANPNGDKDKKKSSITLAKVKDLCFGAIVTSPTAGTIVLDPSGSVTLSGGVYSIHPAGWNPQAALFVMTLKNGEHEDDDEHECDRNERDDNTHDDDRTTFDRDGLLVHISVSSSITLHNPSGSSMTADHFTIKRTNGNINVGATLHVGARQPNQAYTGDFMITTSLE
ncbi:MAG: DUF4402 domain-containing protein [Ignavibacteriota bacterium]